MKIKQNILSHKSAIKLNKTATILIVCTIAISIFGCVMVYSASCYSALKHYGNEFFFLTKQIFGVVVGTIGLIAFSFINYNKLKKF